MTNPLGYHTPTDRYDNDFDRRIAAIELGNAVAYFLGLKPQDEIPFTELTAKLRSLKPSAYAVIGDRNGDIVALERFLFGARHVTSELEKEWGGTDTWSIVPLFAGAPLKPEVEHKHRPSTFGPGGPIESAITICLDCGKILPTPKEPLDPRDPRLASDEGWDGIK